MVLEWEPVAGEMATCNSHYCRSQLTPGKEYKIEAAEKRGNPYHETPYWVIFIRDDTGLPRWRWASKFRPVKPPTIYGDKPDWY